MLQELHVDFQWNDCPCLRGLFTLWSLGSFNTRVIPHCTVFTAYRLASFQVLKGDSLRNRTGTLRPTPWAK